VHELIRVEKKFAKFHHGGTVVHLFQVVFFVPPSFATIDLGGWDQQAPSQPLPPDTVRRTSAPRVPKRVADEHIGSFRSGVGQERVQFINGVSRLAGDRY